MVSRLAGFLAVGRAPCGCAAVAGARVSLRRDRQVASNGR